MVRIARAACVMLVIACGGSAEVGGEPDDGPAETTETTSDAEPAPGDVPDVAIDPVDVPDVDAQDTEETEETEDADDTGPEDPGPPPPDIPDSSPSDPGADLADEGGELNVEVSDPADPGETCGAAFEVGALPFVAESTTVGASSNYGYGAGACPGELEGWGWGSSDHVYRLTPEVDGVYTITLLAGFDSTLYAVTTCLTIDETCLGAADVVGVEKTEQLVLTLAAGAEIFIVVDGYGNTSDESGPYLLEVSAACIPDCAEKSCGPDGCGGSCGLCAVGESCEEGICEGAPTICEPIGEVTCGQLISVETLAGATDAFESYGCQVAPLADFGLGLERTWLLSLPEKGAVVTVSGPVGVGLDVTALADQGLGCQDAAGACLGQGPGELVFTADETDQVYLVWDSAVPVPPPEALQFEVTCCFPSCAEVACGDDGCGGSCGGCADGLVCQAGGCVALPTACEAAGALSCGVALTKQSNTMPGATDAIGLPCTGAADLGSSPEVTYELTVDTTTVVTIEVGTKGTSNPLLMITSGGCGPALETCVAQGDGSVTFQTTAGETYRVTVDFAGTTAALGVAFDVAVSCCAPVCDGESCGGGDGCGGTCGCGPEAVCEAGACVAAKAGDACGTAIEVTKTPFFYPTAVTGTDLLGCGAVGNDTPEDVFVFTPEKSAVYTIDVGAFDGAVYVLGDCEHPDASCVGGSQALSVALLAGETYWIVVDGVGFYALEVNPPCTQKCSGKTCGADGCGSVCGVCSGGQACVAGACSPAPDTCIPTGEIGCDETLFGLSNVSGAVTNAFATYSCQPSPALDFGQSLESVWLFATDVPLTVSVSAKGADGLSLTVLKETEAGCADSVAGCISQVPGTGKTVFEAEAGAVYNLVWDAAAPIKVTDFEMTLTCCKPTGCDGVYCGGNGCGAPCPCPLGDVCNLSTETCAPPKEGELCATAFVIGDLPFEASGDTSEWLDDLHYPAGACPPETSGWGKGAPDHVYALTAVESGTYHITLTAEYDSNLYVLASCEDPATSCLAGDEEVGIGAVEMVTIALTEGQKVFVVVDGWATPIASGAYALTVEKL